MRIGIIADNLGIRCGIGRYTHELILGLEAVGFEVEKISPTERKSRYADAINHIYTLPYSVYRRKSQFDIFHATSPITGLAFPFIGNRAKIVTYHDIFSLLCKECKAGIHVKATAKQFLKIGLFSDKIITVSTQTKNELITHLGFPREKIDVINLGVDDRFYPFEKTPCDEYTIGYLGDLAQRKRIDYIISAMCKLKQHHPEFKAKLSICGNGSDYPRLKNAVKSLQMQDRIEFKGYIPENRLPEIYNSFDIFVLPSEWEGFGIPILEAQKCGIPVIIRDDAHIPDETSRFCLKAKSEQEMAEMIYELLINDHERTRAIRDGLEYSKQFTWGKMVESTINVYKQLLP